jgi:hypothetical protein
MIDLTPEQLHWLRLLKEHRPGNGGSELSIPPSVCEFLLGLRLAYRREGSACVEISFEGIQEVRKHGDGLGPAEKLCLLAITGARVGPSSISRIPPSVREVLLAKNLICWNAGLLEVSRKGAQLAMRLRTPSSY